MREFSTDRRRRPRHDGCRHRRGLRPQRLRRDRRRASTTRRSTAVAQHLEHSTGRAVERGKLTEAEQAELLGRITFTTVDGRPGRLRPRRRGGRRAARAQAGDLPASSTTIVAPDAILATNTSSLSVTEISAATSHARPGHRHALLQPGAGAEVRRGHPHRRHRARRARRRPGAGSTSSARARSSCGDKAGFIANALLFGYLNHAVSMYEAPLRDARGHRRRDAARLRLPDGPAGAARPDRSRHGVRDPRHDVQAGPRPAARAGADPQADGHRRAARPQDRPRLLHLRGARQLRSSCADAADPGRPTTQPQLRRDISRVGVVGSGHDGDRASSRSSPRPGSTSLYVAPQPRTRSTRVPGSASSARSRRPSSAASSTEDERDEALGR